MTAPSASEQSGVNKTADFISNCNITEYAFTFGNDK